MTTPAEPTTQNPPRGGRKSSSSAAAAGGGGGKKENVFTRKLGPLPMWVWVAIIGAAVVLYAMWKGKSSSSSPAAPGPAGGPGFGSSLLPPVVVHGARGPRGRRGRPGKGDGDGGDQDEGDGDRDGRGRRRRRRRRRDRDDRDRDRNQRSHDEDGDREPDQDEDEKRPARAATRAVPGAGPVAGTLQSFTTPQSGTSPSLAQVAAQFNTAPDAIVEEATGRGSPHGALWRRYVAAHDWQAPLPHGTDMTILQQPQ